MATAAQLLVATLVVAAAAPTAGLLVRGASSEQAQWGRSGTVRSKIGTLSLPQWSAKCPYATCTAWRETLGERIVRAADASGIERHCSGFLSFGDMAWCADAMPSETNVPAGDGFPAIAMSLRTDGRTSKHTLRQRGEKFHGLSYGIEARDLWSELISNRFGVRTTLYDCYYNGTFAADRKQDGPMQVNLHRASCPPWREASCYSLPYEAKPVCLGSEDRTFTPEKATDGVSRAFASLRSGLRNRPPLSVFLKVDTEGSEWEPLAQLLENEDDLKKIRTLDMEVHFNMGTRNEEESLEEAIARRVSIFERVAKRFQVTGSTLDHLHESEDRDLSKVRAENPSKIWKNEPAVWGRKGYSVEMFAISFVNRDLL